MSQLNICLELAAEVDHLKDSQFLEEQYQTVYKPLISFLYAHPKFAFSFSFSGLQIEFFVKKHPEFIQVLKELTGRHQTEVLGSGYYNPVFPLLFPVDRSGQIEKMTTSLRSTIGKRPRGISLFKNIWDPSLTTTLQTCGMEYVSLDNTLIPDSKLVYLPLIVSDQGKSIKVIPYSNNLLPTEDDELTSWISLVQKNIETCRKNGFNEENPIVSLVFNIESFKKIFESKWFLEIAASCESGTKDNWINVTIPQNYLKNAKDFVASYIPSGMEWSIAQWARTPYKRSENKTRFPITIHDFLNIYKQSHRLYERMMYVSILVSQSHGDKLRKEYAREKLWQAQNGIAYVCSPEGIPAAAKLRQEAYRFLNEAEKVVRECKGFKESLTSYDYNGDGLNEYICQMDKFHAVINLHSGEISEMDLIKNGGNYADSLGRLVLFEGINDNYQRGLFVDHIFEKSDMEKYIKCQNAGNGVFSEVQFNEKKFDAARHEILMEGKGEFSELRQPLSLRKKYIVSTNGFIIQYILKNESPLPVKGFFAVESNFAQTVDLEDNVNQYQIELIADGERVALDENNSFNKNEGVSVIQISDVKDNANFVFEPNEEAGFACSQIIFNRPDSHGNIICASKTFTSALYWTIELSGGMEIEKTINLSIVDTKKKRSKKKYSSSQIDIPAEIN